MNNLLRRSVLSTRETLPGWKNNNIWKSFLQVICYILFWHEKLVSILGKPFSLLMKHMIYCYDILLWRMLLRFVCCQSPKNSQHSELEQACDFSPHACSSPTLLASFCTACGSRMLWDPKCASYILGYLHNVHHICLCEMAKTASIYREASCLYWLICIFSTNLVAQFLIF